MLARFFSNGKELMKGKIGIALGAGAARGWAHIGVLRTLAKAGIHPDIVVGTSMGAVVGGCYAADHLDPIEEFAASLTRRSFFSYLDFSLKGDSLITGQRLCTKLEQRIKAMRIERMGRQFAAVATEVDTGHEVWIKRGRLIEAIRASYAIPGIFSPVQVKNRWLMDGAIVNPVPVSVCRAMGARTVIAVNLNSDQSVQGSVIPDHGSDDFDISTCPEKQQIPDDASGTRGALKLLHKQFFGESDGAPGMTTVMLDAVNIMQDRISRARLAGDPPDLTIRPQLGDVGLFEFYRAQECIDAGVEATEQKLNEVDGTLDMFVS